MLLPGIYEQVINQALSNDLADISEALKKTKKIDQAEAPKILSQYLTEVIQKGLENIFDNGGDLSTQISLVNQVITLIGKATKEADYSDLNVDHSAHQLLALLREKDPRIAVGKTAADMPRPETSIAHSSLFTGAIHEPQMFSELKKEIISADRIDMLVSFIKWSGLRLIINELRDFTFNGGQLRVITTSYMGATDVKAVEELSKLSNTEIKVSYDTDRTRLHAKAYIFYRSTGFTTAYVGSSNLSNAAISTGLEWNVKITRSDLSETIDKITATFESYWNSSEFEFFTTEQQGRLIKALKAEATFRDNDAAQYTLDIRPYSYQQEILDRLEAERTVRGYNRNLIVAATGTGKTVISALDYKNFRNRNPYSPCRLLFVAHREEILRQSMHTFRAVLKDANFGELYVGAYHPESIDYLFISIQTFNAQDFTSKTEETYYDYIIIDEFHHAAAPTYQKLLGYYHSKILLGLTATPERMDGKNILEYFNHRIAAEIRLPEAIERQLLCPFQYFGITDTVDLKTLRWTQGGYDKTELSNLYTISGLVAKKRADMIVASIQKYLTDINAVKGLAFCVSVEHAQFMASHFNSLGIPSMYLTGSSPAEERKSAQKQLVFGQIRFIFVVDLYNEGVDIPEINTVLFLRPTQSLTVFLQQLGRGLRLSENKECLTVLDFIGQANTRYNFEEKFAALLSNTTRSVTREIKDGFIAAPRGCYIQLEKQAARYILDNIQASYGNTRGLISRIMTFSEDTGLECTLSNFLDYYHLDPRALYKFALFSRMRVKAGGIDDFTEAIETTLTKAISRLSIIDSRRWINFLLKLLPDLTHTNLCALSDMEKRMLQMFYVTVWQDTIDDWNDHKVNERLNTLADSPILLAELIELLHYQYSKIDFIDQPIDLGFDCPLDLHCTYTRDQLFVAMDFLKPATIREGVKWLPKQNVDVLLITLNKSDKDYSPTTMYNDYSINERLFHWQSQSVTSESSATGQRYIHHRQNGSKVLLFVREYKTDKISNGAEAYTYLGPATYKFHTGSKPMNITWELQYPIPAKFMKKTSKLIVS